MATLLLNLRNVPDDEADDVRGLLDEHRIVFYETRPSRWGVSAGAIWIADDDATVQARQLMDQYQASRRSRARAEHASALEDGTAPTWRSTLREEPMRVLLTVFAAACLLALVSLPVFLIGR